MTYKSIGYIDFGNNQLYEVMVEENFTVESGGFCYDNFPVWLASHDDLPTDPMTPLKEFIGDLARDQPHHLNAVIIQLGSIFEAAVK